MLKSKNPNKSLLRALEVLKLFNTDTFELGSTDVARRGGIPVSTAHRILSTLTESGLLDQDKKTHKYMIGPEISFLGSLFLKKTDMFQAASPIIKVLNELTKETISIATYDKGNIIYIMREEAHHVLRYNVHVGSTIPAHSSAIGRALLSELPETDIDSLYPEEKLRSITKKTISTKSKLKLELQQIRETGVSFDSEGTFEGVDAIGSVIRKVDGKAVAAISIALPTTRMNRGNRELFAVLVKMGASLISYRFGYKDMVNPALSIEEIRSWWAQNKLNTTCLL